MLTPPVIVVVRQVCKSASMPDPGSCVGAAKAMLDAVVEQGKLPDDSGRYVAELRFVAPVRGTRNSLTLEFWPC